MLLRRRRKKAFDTDHRYRMITEVNITASVYGGIMHHVDLGERQMRGRSRIQGNDEDKCAKLSGGRYDPRK